MFSLVAVTGSACQVGKDSIIPTVIYLHQS